MGGNHPQAGRIAQWDAVVNNPHLGRISPTPAQLRAARAALGLSLAEVAEKTGLGVNTVTRAEKQGLQALTAANADRLVVTLEGLGIGFLDPDATQGPGLRLPR